MSADHSAATFCLKAKETGKFTLEGSITRCALRVTFVRCLDIDCE